MIPIVLQARMSSRRLPGKSLLSLEGRALLDRVVELCLQNASAAPVLVATSTDPSDDAIAAHGAKRGWSVHRGDLHDVAARFAGVVRQSGAEAFVRISADSPFLDARLIDQAIRIYREAPCDLVTTTFPRTYPKGQSVELVRASVFLQTIDRMTSPGDREHVTAHFYREAGHFGIRTMACEGDFSSFNMCVDTREDFERAGLALRSLGPDNATFTWRQALDALQAVRA